LPLEDGVEGEIIFTGLERECGPLLRWRDKDIIKLNTSPCECGRPGVRMSFKGRVDDMLLVKGVNVFPNAVRDVINSQSPHTSGNIRMVLPEPGPVAASPVAVLVEYSAELGEQQRRDLAAELESAIHHQLRFRANIVLQAQGLFELKTGATGKSKLLEVDSTFQQPNSQ